MSAMLVLSRKKLEEVRIGENIVVKVLEIRGGSIRLGIIAPTEVPIERPEAKRKAA